MIVQCDQCQTRFRISDEKVTERGVKVRCTRCQHTFTVSKQAQAAPAQVPLAAAPPLAQRPAPTFGAPPVVPLHVFEAPTRVQRFPSTELRGASAPAEVPEAAAPGGADPFAAPEGESDGGMDPFDEPDEASGGAALNSFAAPGGESDGAMDPFGAADEDLGGQDWSEQAGSPGESEDPRSMFDFVRPTGGAGLLPEVPPAESESAVRPLAAALAPAAPSKRGVEPLPLLPMELEAVARTRRGVLPAVIKALVAAGFVLALAWVGLAAVGEGRTGVAALRGLFSPALPLVVTDLSNGLYDTRSGRAVFYVRGEVSNRGARALPAKVRVEILDEDVLVRAAEVRVGQAPTPEDLFGIDGAIELEALQSKLEAGAKDVAPGERLPFLIAFYEYPPQLGFRLQVVVTQAAASTAEN